MDEQQCVPKESSASDMKSAKIVDAKDDKYFEDDGEDLPDNFFDDFSNQDFMEGLNVVDDWNDDGVEDSQESKDYEDTYRKNSKNEKTDKKVQKENRKNNKRRESYKLELPAREQKKPYYRNRRSRSLHKHSPPKGSHREENKSSKLKPEHVDKRDSSIDRRRDPEKTKRDIQRDKLRCAKDHTARVFQEQLKIAETGLVPPGTELDIVLSSEKFQEGEPLKPPHGTKKQEDKKLEKTTEKKKEDSLRHRMSRSPVNKVRRRRPYGRSISREKQFSPKRRRRSTKSREREHKYKDSPEVDLRYRLREKRERHLVERSPLRTVQRRYSRSRSPLHSPISPVSERETWLRSRDRFSASRISRQSRSLSPLNTSRIRDASPRKKKFSFMEEIEIKLRQTQPIRDPSTYKIPHLMSLNPQPEFFPHQVQYQQNAPMFMAQTPLMCPPTEQFPQPMIMGTDPNMMQPMFSASPMFAHNVPAYSVPQPVPAPSMYIEQNRTPIHDTISGAIQEKQSIAKLFEDKKISLSDFLSVAAKPLDSSAPVDIHTKIKVISRCQEAIKILEDPKLIGRFFPRVSRNAMEAEKRSMEMSKAVYQSPLKKAVVCRFNFTVPVSKRATGSKNLDQLSARSTLHKLTTLLGIAEQAESTPPVPLDLFVQLQTEPVSPTEEIRKPIIKTSNSSSQTDPVVCQICEIRSARKLSDGQTQTDPADVCSMSTQVSIEDLTKSCTTFIPRGILKNNTSPLKSISHMTPAQLLAQLGAEKKEDMNRSMQKDTFPAYGRSYSDTPRPNPHLNPYGDNFKGGDITNSQPNMYSGNPSPGKYIPDRFGSSALNPATGFNNMGRGNNFGSQVNDSRAYGGFQNQGRPFPDTGSSSNFSNLSNWNNPPMGRGNNPRGFNNTQNNPYYNSRGQN